MDSKSEDSFHSLQSNDRKFDDTSYEAIVNSPTKIPNGYDTNNPSKDLRYNNNNNNSNYKPIQQQQQDSMNNIDTRNNPSPLGPPQSFPTSKQSQYADFVPGNFLNASSLSITNMNSLNQEKRLSRLNAPIYHNSNNQLNSINYNTGNMSRNDFANNDYIYQNNINNINNINANNNNRIMNQNYSPTHQPMSRMNGSPRKRPPQNLTPIANAYLTSSSNNNSNMNFTSSGKLSDNQYYANDLTTINFNTAPFTVPVSNRLRMENAGVVVGGAQTNFLNLPSFGDSLANNTTFNNNLDTVDALESRRRILNELTSRTSLRTNAELSSINLQPPVNVNRNLNVAATSTFQIVSRPPQLANDLFEDPISSNDMDQLINVMAKRRLAIKKLEDEMNRQHSRIGTLTRINYQPSPIKMTKDGSSQTNLRIYDQSGESGGGASGVNAGVGTGSGGGLNSLRRPPGLNFLADNARNMIDAAGSSLHLGSASTNASMLLFNNSGLGGDHTTANSSLAQRPPPSNLRAYQVESKRDMYTSFKNESARLVKKPNDMDFGSSIINPDEFNNPAYDQILNQQQLQQPQAQQLQQANAMTDFNAIQQQQQRQNLDNSTTGATAAASTAMAASLASNGIIGSNKMTMSKPGALTREYTYLDLRATNEQDALKNAADTSRKYAAL